jgi:zinc finger HIT domain-containing protein 1
MSGRRSDRRKTTVVSKPEVKLLTREYDFRVEQLERDQASGAFDTTDVAEDVLGEGSESDVEMSRKKKARSVTARASGYKRKGAKRDRKSVDDLLIDEKAKAGDTFISVLVKPSKYPSMRLCSVCLEISKYTCIKCGLRYCCLACQKTHSETKCLKFSF